MKIAGFQPFSLIDYPGKTSAIIFTRGCPFRCPYCHNPELVTSPTQKEIDVEGIYSFFEKRRTQLDAVTITGGEPTVHRDLPQFIRRIRDLGYLIKLDTNGTNPVMLATLLDERLIDAVAMDIKGPLQCYADIVCMPVRLDDLRRSITLIIEAAIPSEFRTTVVQGMLDEQDFEEIGKMIAGAKKYFLQRFLPTKTIQRDFMNRQSPTLDELSVFQRIMRGYVAQCEIRL